MSLRDLRKGFVDTLPLGVGVTIYGLVYGMVGRQGGLPLWLVVGMSLVVFAGSSQIMAVEMLSGGAGPLSTIVTVLVVNLRHIVMGADLAPYFEGQPALKKCLAAFFMTDESYASSYTHFRLAASDEGENRLRYMLGAGWNIYLFWGLSSAVGYLSGNLIPEILEPAFSFAMAAAFLSMLLPIVRELPTVAAVLTSAAVAVAGALWLPGKWYILLATFAGSLVGFLFGEAKARRKKEAQA